MVLTYPATTDLRPNKGELECPRQREREREREKCQLKSLTDEFK